MAKRSHGRADSLQPSLDKVVIAAGGGVIPCSQYPMLGFDRIYLYGGGLFICEIKSTKRAKLTKQELRRQKQCLTYNIPYHVIYSEGDLLLVLGLTAQKQN